jgi:hypothetical protein
MRSWTSSPCCASGGIRGRWNSPAASRSSLRCARSASAQDHSYRRALDRIVTQSCPRGLSDTHETAWPGRDRPDGRTECQGGADNVGFGLVLELGQTRIFVAADKLLKDLRVGQLFLGELIEEVTRCCEAAALAKSDETKCWSFRSACSPFAPTGEFVSVRRALTRV